MDSNISSNNYRSRLFVIKFWLDIDFEIKYSNSFIGTQRNRINVYEHDLKDYQETIKWKRKYANITGDKYAAYRSIASYYDGIRVIDSVKYYPLAWFPYQSSPM